ncbi:hypothetical protein BOTBODRAFT_180733 [Botryobasidium botryosum FD-172 SS1]|uniref:Uncharacterized protein n=1 Tax=Botryobasidium botryosum (strain FD-172 SS1) TaxID=930990 RepID=A0A067LW55_BOTB1|nr:hypothetical protein BOTBODRAFT_180733 [Botryobasidium botryosum FD-172 SS1]
MNDLPIGTREIFKSDFLPSYFDFLGSRTHPFDMSENRLVVEQQFIWDTYLESFPVNITPRSPVYNLVQQRSYEWKAGFGKAAFAAVSELWALDEDRFGTAFGRAEYVKWALGWRKPFSWENGDDFVNPYHGPLLLAVLAKHFDETNGKYGYGNPCGALALSATAVGRALSAWSSGNLEKAADFGAKLSDGEWVSIINNALAPHLQGHTDTTDSLIPDNDDEDDRSLLVSGPQLPP